MLKPGVRITGMRPEILLAAVAAERVYEEAGHDFTITACVDGKHMTGSLHYAGAAIDVRTRDFQPADVQKSSRASSRAWATTSTCSSKWTTSISSSSPKTP